MQRIIEKVPYSQVEYVTKRLMTDGTPYQKSISFSLSLFIVNFVLMSRYITKNRVTENEEYSDVTPADWQQALDDFSSIDKNFFRQCYSIVHSNPHILEFFDNHRDEELYHLQRSDFSACVTFEPVYSQGQYKLKSYLISLILRICVNISSISPRKWTVFDKINKNEDPLIRSLIETLPINNMIVMPVWLFYLIRFIIKLTSKSPLLSRKKIYQSAVARQLAYIYYEQGLLNAGSHGGQADSSRWSNVGLWAASLNINWSSFNVKHHAIKCSEKLRQERFAIILYSHDEVDIRMRSGMEARQFKQYQTDIRQLVCMLKHRGHQVDLCAYPNKDHNWVVDLICSQVSLKKYDECRNHNYKIATYPSSVFLHESDAYAKIKCYYFRLEHWPRSWSDNDLRLFKCGLFAENLIELEEIIGSQPLFDEQLHMKFCGLS